MDNQILAKISTNQQKERIEKLLAELRTCFPRGSEVTLFVDLNDEKKRGVVLTTSTYPNFFKAVHEFERGYNKSKIILDS